MEIRDNFDGDTHRTDHTRRLESVLYVLHAFQKNQPAELLHGNGISIWCVSASGTPKLSTRQQRQADDEHEEEVARL